MPWGKESAANASKANKPPDYKPVPVHFYLSMLHVTEKKILLHTSTLLISPVYVLCLLRAITVTIYRDMNSIIVHNNESTDYYFTLYPYTLRLLSTGYDNTSELIIIDPPSWDSINHAHVKQLNPFYSHYIKHGQVHVRDWHYHEHSTLNLTSARQPTLYLYVICRSTGAMVNTRAG